MTDWPDLSAFDTGRAGVPLILPWPMPGYPGAMPTFDDFAAWREFILARSLDPAVPEIVAAKYRRAQRLYLFAWLEFDLIKAGELVALTALELTLRDQYGSRQRLESQARTSSKRKKSARSANNESTTKVSESRPSLSSLLRFMVQHDGLSGDALPSARSYGRPISTLLYGGAHADGSTVATHLVSIRNGLAHGDPFDGLPWGGLLDLVHDLIEYAYRERLQIPSS